MVFPDYNGGSIVNLMSSIAVSRGGKTKYPELKQLNGKKLKNYKNVVLIVIDGLGFEFLKKHAKNTIFEKHLIGEMTSVFPATTASAVTAYITGNAPQEHGFTGWFMNMKEIGTVVAMLPFRLRIGGGNFANYMDLNPEKFKDVSSFSEKIKCNSAHILNKEYSKDTYSQMFKGNYDIIGHNGKVNGFYKKIEKNVKKQKSKSYTLAYWPKLDMLIHDNYPESDKVLEHLNKLSCGFEKFMRRIKRTNTCVIVTADHGLVKTPKNGRIVADNIPGFVDCLSAPLCGEPRVAYCYVKPSKEKEFLKIVKTKLKNKFDVIKSETALKKGYFGKGKVNPKLIHRIGDYILIAKKNYCILDGNYRGKPSFMKGNHGGTSREEMIVPLIVVDSD